MSDQQMPGTSQELDRIRDIIFGSQMRDYQQQFQALQRDVKRLQDQLDRLSGQLAEQDSNQGKKNQALRSELRQADEELRSELRESTHRLASDKVERADLGRLFVELGSQLSEGRSASEILQSLMTGEQDSQSED
jgi:predicted RNase H-like nuclease (RuvC/YqgF family)